MRRLGKGGRRTAGVAATSCVASPSGVAAAAAVADVVAEDALGGLGGTNEVVAVVGPVAAALVGEEVLGIGARKSKSGSNWL